jgi:tetratricopeptide (TPR) repeat protein
MIADNRFTAIAFLLLAALTVNSQVGDAPKLPTTNAAGSLDFERARRLFAEGSLDQAITTAKHGLVLSPRSIAGLNLLGVIYNQQGKYEEAVPLFQQALTVAPNSTETLINLATTYVAQNKANLAEQMFRKALRLQPGNRTANYNLGALLLGENKAKEALPHLLRISSPDQTTRLLTIRAYLDAGMLSAGLAASEKLSQESEKDTRTHFSIGVLLASHRQYRQAAYEFEQADALQPGNFDILHDLGQAYLLSGQLPKAQDTLNRALRLQPDSADTLYLLAQTAAQMRKEVDALELLVQARKIAPNNTNILFLMAQLSMKQSFFEDAIELLKEGLKIDFRRADFHAALGESYFTVGKVDDALQEFKTLVSLDPSPRSYVFMALCYRHLGQYDEAKRYLKQSLSADPNNLPTLFNLGFIARKEGDYPQSEQYLQRAVRLDKDYPEVLFELGSLKMDQKKFDQAVPLLRHFVEVSPNPTQGYYKLALSERSLDQSDAAQRDMNVFQTLSKSPEPAPYPLQHFFDYLERRSALSAEQQNETDLRELEAEVKQHPDRPRSLHLLAEAHLKLGHASQAMEVLQRLDALSGGDFRTELNTGVMLGRFHLYTEAIRYFQAALKINPSSDDAKYNLAEAQFQSGNYADALQVLQQVSSDDQKESSYLALLGDVYARLGRYVEASRCLQQAIASAPDNDQYYASLAVVQLQNSELDDADHTLRSGLARIPDSGALYWTAGIVAAVRGHGRDAESFLKKASELSPSRESVAATLGIFYFEEGRFFEARGVLSKCEEMFPQGTLDFQKINAVLNAASSSGTREVSENIPPEARKEFYELALAMRDQEQ